MFLGELFDEVEEEALELGREQGRAEGLEQGRTEARAKTLEETAMKFKAAGVPMATIVECTGLSEEEVEAL